MWWPQGGNTWSDHSDFWQSCSAQNWSWLDTWERQSRWGRSGEEERAIQQFLKTHEGWQESGSKGKWGSKVNTE